MDFLNSHIAISLETAAGTEPNLLYIIFESPVQASTAFKPPHRNKMLTRRDTVFNETPSSSNKDKHRFLYYNKNK